MSSNYDTFLGGACNPTTWRQDAIKKLEKDDITFYNPQKPDWSPELVEKERNAKHNSAILLFVFQPSVTTGVCSLIEVSYLSGIKNNLVLVMPKWTRNCDLNENLKLEQAYEIVKKIAISSSAKLYNNIEDALLYITSRIKEKDLSLINEVISGGAENEGLTCNHVRSSINSFLERVEDQIRKFKTHRKTKTLGTDIVSKFERMKMSESNLLRSRNLTNSCQSLDTNTLLFETKQKSSCHMVFDPPSDESIQNELKRLSITPDNYQKHMTELILSFLYKSKDILLMNPYEPGVSIKRSISVDYLEKKSEVAEESSCVTCIKRSFSHRTQRALSPPAPLILKQPRLASKRPTNLTIPDITSKRSKCEGVLNFDLIIVGDKVPDEYCQQFEKNDISYLRVDDPSDHNQFLGCLMTIFIIDGRSMQVSNLVHASYLTGLRFPIILVISPDLDQKNLPTLIKSQHFQMVKSHSVQFSDSHNSAHDTTSSTTPSSPDSGLGSAKSGNTPVKTTHPVHNFEGATSKKKQLVDESTIKDFLRGIAYIKDLAEESKIPILPTTEQAFKLAFDWLINAKRTSLNIC